MSTPDYFRLYTAALQLAAAFEHAFPGGARRRVVWSFLVEGDWKEDVEYDPGVGTPMNRWAAFLENPEKRFERKRYQLFELMVEDILELRGIIAAMSRCRVELRRAISATKTTPRELLVFATLFRQLRRSRWTADVGLCLHPCDSDGFTNVCTVEVRPPNVALVREMARAVGVESPLTPAHVGQCRGRRRGGRPANEQLPIWKAEAKRLRDLGYSYRKVSEHLRGKFDIDRSPEAIEKWVKELRGHE